MACGGPEQTPFASDAKAGLPQSDLDLPWISPTAPVRPVARPAQATVASQVQPEFSFGPYRQYQRMQGSIFVFYEAIAAGDFTGDGRTDLVALPSSHNQIELFVQQSNGILAAPTVWPYGGENYFVAKAMVTDDFNEDGVMDVAHSIVDMNGAAGGVGVLLSNRGGAPVYKVGYPNGVGEGVFTASLDVDADGHRDLVGGGNYFMYEGPGECGADYCPRYTVLYGDGRGNFGRRRTFNLGLPLSIGELAAHDLNDDGTLDLVMVMTGTQGYPVISLGKVMVAYRLPDGGLAPPIELHDAYGIAGGHLAFGDINGDGIDDSILAFNDQRKPTEIRMRSVNGTFPAPLYLAHRNLLPSLPLLADFDGDGRTDLTNHQFGEYNSTPYMAVYLHRNGTLQAPMLISDPPVQFAMNVSMHRLAYAAGDLNGDGCNDMAIVAGYDGILFLDGQNCVKRTRTLPGESGFYRTRPSASPATIHGKARAAARIPAR